MTNSKFPKHVSEHNCDDFNCKAMGSCCAYFDGGTCFYDVKIGEVTGEYCNKSCPLLMATGIAPLNYDYWFNNQVKKLSPEVKKNFDSLWEQVCKYGMMYEIYEWTFNYFKDVEGSSNEFEEKFMRAVNWAMDEWDL